MADCKKVIYDIACDLLIYGYGLGTLLEYDICKQFSKEEVKDIWKKAFNDMTESLI